MNPGQEGRWFRSDPLTYSLSNTLPVRLDFLAAARYMTAPEVADIVLRFSGTVGAVTGGALGRDAAKLFDNVRFTDEAEVINASGAMLRVLEQMEFGTEQQDPADVSSGSTNTAYVYRLCITAEPRRAHRPRDTRIPLAHFLEGGQFLISTPAAVPTGWAAVQADQTVRLFVRVVDGRTPEVKSRFRIREEVVQNQEYDYAVNGSIRAAILGSKLTTTGYTSLAAFTTINSRTLDLPPAFQTDMLIDKYRRSHVWSVDDTNDEFARTTTAAIPIVSPNRWKKIGEMIDTRTLHLDLLAAAPASGRLLTWNVMDRTPNLAALVGGFSSVPDYQRALAAYGRVVDGKPGGSRITDYAPSIARRLPVRFRPGIK